MTAEDAPMSEVETAAAWYARLQDAPQLERSAEFQAWLGRPGNRSRLASIDNMMRQFGDIASAPSIVELRGEALRSLPLPGSGRHWRRWYAVAATIVIAICTAVAFNMFLPDKGITYRTALGERRTVQLADGSVLSMDMDTEVEVAFSRRQRSLSLHHGQARFEVAHNVERPFIVEVAGNKVRATGTAFNINRLDSRVEVTLLQGRVIVTPPDENIPRVGLVPGERLTAIRGQRPIVRQVDISAATAWEQGRLVITEESVSSVIQRLDHYAPRRWDIDPRIGRATVSGVFDAGNTDAFLDALRTFAPVKISVDDQGVTHLDPFPNPMQKNILARR